MGEPAYQLPEEDRPEIRPDDIPGLRVLEGGGESSQPRSGHLRSVGGGDQDEGPSLFKPGGDDEEGGGAAGALGALAAAEAGPVGFAYTAAEATPFGRKILGWVGANRKKSGAGIIVSLLLAVGLFFSISTLGSLELVQLSHALEKSFARGDHESSSRVSRLFRYARLQNTGDIGETRVGVIGSKVFGKAISDLNDIGVSYDDRTRLTGRPTSLSIDQEKLAKSLPDLDTMKPGSVEAQNYIAKNLGIDPETLIASPDGKFNVDLQGSDIKSVRLLQKNSLKLLDDGKITTALKMRILSKFFDTPSMFHPFSKLRTAVEQKIAAALAKQKEDSGESKQQAESEANQEAADQENQQNAVTTTEQPFADEAETASEALETAKSGIASKITTGLTFTGAACIVRNSAAEITKVNHDIVYLPAAAAAMRIVAAGEQTQAAGTDKASAGDTTLEQQAALIKSFTSKDGQTIFQSQALQSLLNPNKKPTGQAMPLQYETAFSGKSGGKDIESGADQIISDSAGSLGLSPSVVCSGAGLATQAVLAVGISIGSEILTGGFDTPAVAAVWAAKFVATTVRSMIVYSTAIALVEHVAIHSKLPQEAFSGPIGGSLLAYGSRAASDISAVSTGGISLGNDDNTMNVSDQQQVDYNDFKSQSFFARMFSTKDYNSLTARIGSALYQPNWSATLSSATHHFFTIGSSVSSIFSSFIPHANADTTGGAFNWDFPQYGIPDDMLNDPTLADPYANAAVVAQALDNGGQNYIDKASDCFGVTIGRASDNTWDVTRDHEVDTNSVDYENAGCNETGTGGTSVDPGLWRRVIMFVYDTSTVKPAGCFEGDDQSCTDLGIGGGPSDTSPTTTAPTGTTIDPTTLGQSSVGIPCAGGTRDVGNATGYTAGNPVQIHLCAIPGLPSSSEESVQGSSYYVNGANGDAVVNAPVSGAFLSLVKAATAAGIPMHANSSFRTMDHQTTLCNDNSLCSSGSYKLVAKPGTSNHQMGLAVDFTMADTGQFDDSSSTCVNVGGRCEAPGDKVWEWLNTNASTFGLKPYVNEYWHWSPSGN